MIVGTWVFFFPVLAMYQMRMRDMYICNWLLREQFGKFSETQCFHIWCLMKVKQIPLRPAKLFFFILSSSSSISYKRTSSRVSTFRYCRWQSYLHVEYVALWLTLLLLYLFSGNVTPVTQLCVDLWRLITTL